MADRVGIEINDKVYFVIDEVGNSSFCEEKSKNNMEPTDNLNQTNGESVFLMENRNKLNESNHTSNSQYSNCVNNEDNNSRHSTRSDKSEKSGNNGRLVSTENTAPHSRHISPSEGTSDVVDMELNSDVEEKEEVKPLLRLTFRDEKVEKNLKSSFIKFISEVYENCTTTNSENSLELLVYEKAQPVVSQEDLLDFNLDTTPGGNHKNIPNYGKSLDLVLSDKDDIKLSSNKPTTATATSCFNCMGNHTLRDCTMPKDFKAINMNRLKFQNKKEKVSKSRDSSSRYHLHEDQKFNHLTPGTISRKLRHALNLKRDQQPAFIYRMRTLGYPPAWLEEAKVSHSGVAMYDEIGVPVLEEDEEEGEILPEGAKDRFDLSKLIDFPGFNVPLPRDFKDETDLYKCPKISVEQSKKNLIKLLEPVSVQAYVKKSLTSQKSEEKSPNSGKRPSSPTLENVEETKRQLLLELNSESLTMDSQPSEQSESNSQEPTPEPPPVNKNVGAVKNSAFGTPVLKSVSPFSKLPSREQFSCNVSDVINFENLPNSTGKYESMKEVISKIRITTSKASKG